MTEISKTDPMEMTLDEILEEYDSLPRTAENIDEYKPINARRQQLAEVYNARQGEHVGRVGIATRRILT